MILYRIKEDIDGKGNATTIISALNRVSQK